MLSMLAQKKKAILLLGLERFYVFNCSVFFHTNQSLLRAAYYTHFFCLREGFSKSEYRNSRNGKGSRGGRDGFILVLCCTLIRR